MPNFFRRIEKKCIITKEQYVSLKEAMLFRMQPDEHGESTICNIYFDTEGFDLIRHSITKPIFKDKVRLRSYNVPSLKSTVFLEIKRKYDGVVSKRRIEITLEEFYKNIKLKKDYIPKTQTEKEIYYYFIYYKLHPKMFLSYNRVAFYDKDNKEFRVTFDNNVYARNYDLNLEKGIYGSKILSGDKYIMEVKTLGSMPLWFVKLLEELKIYPSSFSKYGKAYEKLIMSDILESRKEKMKC